ncbi:hypothetical protein ACYTFC_21150 [Streptomyces globosus]|uniref:hypothetical protein n=1 Tax=Streptomyces sp. WAC05292 TaxID=2487418 RepID=UPI000F735D87|nr:hypothetical protein [Streptomyces sp. WAC05292]RSS83156.1 hypothetical protein EF903_26075 [Streptomyces sp. WAC05292]
MIEMRVVAIKDLESVLYGTVADGKIWAALVTKDGIRWLGSWSRPVTADPMREFDALSHALSSRIQNDGRSATGPYGPSLKEHYFFTGWDSWGPGIPAPLKDHIEAQIAAATSRVADLDTQ